ncbi:MAG: type II toxin-antitoxin system RelE/ParE family toxin [Bacteroidetes bacterium]|nr:type II toxin-antitoxin system RelE/ParE family toxin [Bacteroidota bacterium]MCH9029455.1 type II toxin-antitoxin system RelE/ParE family toxin [Bacteroidota bacterium]
MVKYKIEIKKSAVKEIKKLPANDIKKILEKISSLVENPRPAGCLKLSGEEKYRIRFGVYRVLYEIQDNLLLVIVVKVAHRKDVYR